MLQTHELGKEEQYWEPETQMTSCVGTYDLAKKGISYNVLRGIPKVQILVVFHSHGGND